jgi:UDP-N-acetyl-D-mannosaminuronic acid dehydrogenase
MIVSVIGLGYIGLPTAAVLASRGIKVIGVDVNQDTVDTINQGRIHIVEPGLDVLVQSSVQSGHLKAAIKPEKADVFMIAVPTPFKGDHVPDLSYIESAVKSIAPILEKGNLIILESTSPVGTTEKMIEWMKVERPDISFPEFGNNILQYDISVAHCPERVLPGQVIRELVENDRIIGGITIQCAEQARDLYKVFVEASCLITDCRTAELSKLVENSFRDVNIAFANELSLICDKLDINVWETIRLSNHHPRVNILQPGPGVGGHCIAVDPWFIIDSAPDESKLIHAARLVNDSKPSFILEKINQAVSGMSKDKSEITIACLGLSFKPDIDDLRESPALDISKQIALMKFNKVLLVEPNINKIPNGFDVSAKLTSMKDALKSADIVVLLVDHIQFKTINLSCLLDKQVIDTKGIW